MNLMNHTAFKGKQKVQERKKERKRVRERRRRTAALMVSDREINPRKRKKRWFVQNENHSTSTERALWKRAVCACVRALCQHVTYSLKDWIFHSMPTLHFFLLLFVNLMHRKFNANGTSKICFSYKLTLMMMKMKKPLCHPNANVTVQNEYEVKKKQQNVWIYGIDKLT